MGISFDKDARIAGYRPAIFKNALRGFMRTLSPGNLIDLRSVFPLRRDGAMVFEECLDRGLIDPETLKITENGDKIAQAKAQRRTPIAKAKVLLSDFLQRVDDLNHDPKGVHYVNQVWLFGSLMRDEKTVGDIDLAIETARRPDFMADHEGRKCRLKELADRYPDRPTQWQDPWVVEAWVLNRALYGPRRHALLAGVQQDTADLASLAVACRHIYDRERGGQVEDPVLPRHPQSTGRANDLAAPAEMPDLTPTPIRPMDARWVAGFEKTGMVSPYDIFRGWTDDARKLFPHYPAGLRVVGDDYQLNADFWMPKRLRRKGLDGRHAVALINATQWWGTSIVLNREIKASDAVWTLRARFTEFELLRSRKWPEVSTLPDIAAAAALILAVDAERMLRRATELPSGPTIQIDLRSDANEENLCGFFYEPTRELLHERAIRIEPPDWTGSAVAILA